MAINLKRLDQALDGALEAVFDTSRWKQVIADIADATQAFGANIIPAARRNPDLVIHTDSLSAAFEDYFNDGWYANEWRIRALPFLKNAGTACDQQYTSRDVFEKSAYYKFQAKFGIGRTCMIGWHSSPGDLLVLTLHRRLDRDFYNCEDVAVFTQMRERLLVAAKLMNSLGACRLAGMSDAFEATGTAVIFFDRFGKVTCLTSAAEKMLDPALMIQGGELRSRNHAETIKIRQGMQCAIDEKWLIPTMGSKGPVIIPRDRRGPLYIRIQRLGGCLPDFFTRSIGMCLLEAPSDGHSPSLEMLRGGFF